MIEIFLQAPKELQMIILFFVVYATWKFING